MLHAQIEQLRAGREHLAETVRGVRHSIDVIADDLFKAEDEARLAAEAAGREAVARPDEGSPEEIASSLLAGEALARTPPMVDVLGPDAETGSGSRRGVGPGEEGMTAPVTEETPAVDEPPVDEVTAVTAVVEPVVEVVEPVVEVVEPVVEPVDEPVDEPPRPVGPDGGGGDPGTGGESKPSVDDLFAKIRASTGEGEEPAGAATTDDGGSGDSPPEEGDPRRARRDELIAPIVTALSRRLKRTLQDDHNDLLDRLRSGHSAWSLDLLTPEPEHHDIYATAALPFLEEAAQAGASYVGSEGTSGPSVDECWGGRTTWPRRSSAAPSTGRPTMAGSRGPRSRRWPSTSGLPSGSGRAPGWSGWRATSWWPPSRRARSPAPAPSRVPSSSGWRWPGRTPIRAPTARTTPSPDRATRRGVPHRAPSSPGSSGVSMLAGPFSHHRLRSWRSPSDIS